MTVLHSSGIMVGCAKALIILLAFLFGFGRSAASSLPQDSPISIKGSNNFTGESIRDVWEGQSLQLVCVVRNASLTGISWLRNGTTLSFNETLMYQDPRFGLQVDETEKGRRFFRLSIRNISRHDSGNFNCSCSVPGLARSVDIRVRYPPSSEYPKCSRVDSSTNSTAEVYSCQTERGVRNLFSTKWLRDEILQNASNGVSTNDESGIFTSIIRVASANESADGSLECRLYLRNEEVVGRRCCIEGVYGCNNNAPPVLATTTLEESDSPVTLSSSTISTGSAEETTDISSSSTYNLSDVTHSSYDNINSSKAGNDHGAGDDDVTSQYISTTETKTGNLGNKDDLMGSGNDLNGGSSLYDTRWTLVPAILLAYMVLSNIIGY